MQSRKAGNSLGCDISKYQGNVNFVKLKNSGISFVIIKCTEGSSVIDPMFSTNLINAKKVGLKVGVYHFSRASNNQSAIIEAQHFISTINQNGGFKMLDIAPAFDIETKEGSTKSNISGIVRTWVDYVRKEIGIQPMIYTYPNFADLYLDASLADIPLWFANYGVQTPSNHAGWNSWTFLQYSDNGKLDGINGAVDLNEYNGNIEDYTIYTKEDLKMIQELQAQVQALTAEVQKLKEYNAMSSIPTWANESVQNCVNEKLIDSPNGRSYDFYAIITVLHRKGLI